jgi:hypothetical protein
MFGCKAITLRQDEKLEEQSGSWFADSYGLNPAYYSARLKNTLESLSTYGKFQEVSFQLQHSKSNVCAMYSIIFAEKFCSLPTEETSLSEFVNINFYVQDQRENDEKVIMLFSRQNHIPFRSLKCVSGSCSNLNSFLSTPRDSSLE